MGVLIKSDFDFLVKELIQNCNNLKNKFGLSCKDIENLLNAKGKVKVEKCINLLKLINSYYHKKLDLEDVFNTYNIKGYIEHKNNISNKYQNKNDYITMAIDTILRIIIEFFEGIKVKISKKNQNNGILFNDNNFIIKIIILFIVLYVVYLLIINYFK